MAVPRRLKAALSRLLSAPVEEIILGNSTSYGLHLLANGLPLQRDDEVLVSQDDFPATILPWCGLRSRGINVRVLSGGQGQLFDQIAAALNSRTRVVCLSWVNSFTGVAIDLNAIGDLCRAHGAWFVVNASQAVGTRVLDVSSTPVDAVCACGFKWLCGPYGTGFCWARSAIIDQLSYNQRYWLPEFWQSERGESYSVDSPPVGGAQRYDLFCTANFFNFMPWTVGIEHLTGIGIARIQEHNESLVAAFVHGLDNSKVRVVASSLFGTGSSIVSVSSVDPNKNAIIHQQLTHAGIDVALRRGNLRVSPHLFNSNADIMTALRTLHDAA